MRQPSRTSTAGTSALLLAGLVLAWTACAPDSPDRRDDVEGQPATAGPDSVDAGSGEPAPAAAATPDAGSSPATADDGDDNPYEPPPIPTGPSPSLDVETALTVLSGPLSCIDRPQALPANRSGYLYAVTYTRRPGFEQDRAFYGCWDWHSAVNSMWAMVRMVKEMPEITVATLVREKLGTHITAGTMQGELEYLAANPVFERPYGWVWLLLLHAELASWDDPEAEDWAEHMEPVADLFADRLAEYLRELNRPVRSGTHRSTAFALSMGLQAVALHPRRELERVLGNTARRFFADDEGCDLEDEPGMSDFLSPCLEEAALMAAVMDPGDFAPWLDSLLPSMDSEEFAPLRTSALTDSTGNLDLQEMVQTIIRLTGDSANASTFARVQQMTTVPLNDTTRASRARRSHLIGLAFARADAMLRIAAALPATDPRVEKFRQLASYHGRTGLETMFDAHYAGSHWISSFALKYLVEVEKERDP